MGSDSNMLRTSVRHDWCKLSRERGECDEISRNMLVSEAVSSVIS